MRREKVAPTPGGVMVAARPQDVQSLKLSNSLPALQQRPVTAPQLSRAAAKNKPSSGKAPAVNAPGKVSDTASGSLLRVGGLISGQRMLGNVARAQQCDGGTSELKHECEDERREDTLEGADGELTGALDALADSAAQAAQSRAPADEDLLPPSVLCDFSLFSALLLDDDEDLLPLITKESAEESRDGYLALHLAAEVGASEVVVSKLLDVYPDAARRPTLSQKLPLHLAIEHSASDAVVSRLLCAFPQAASSADEAQLLPLHLAIAAGSDAVVSELLDCDAEAGGAAARVPTADGRLPLHLALQLRKSPVAAVTRLLKSFPEGARAADQGGRLPLHVAAWKHAPDEVLTRLLDAHPGAAQQPDAAGFLPLDVARAFGAPEATVARMAEAAGVLPAHPTTVLPTTQCAAGTAERWEVSLGKPAKPS